MKGLWSRLVDFENQPLEWNEGMPRHPAVQEATSRLRDLSQLNDSTVYYFNSILRARL